jgi:hypothetical protein
LNGNSKATISFGLAIRSTPQPPYKSSSFARQFIYGGFAGYLLLSSVGFGLWEVDWAFMMQWVSWSIYGSSLFFK